MIRYFLRTNHSICQIWHTQKARVQRKCGVTSHWIPTWKYISSTTVIIKSIWLAPMIDWRYRKLGHTFTSNMSKKRMWSMKKTIPFHIKWDHRKCFSLLKVMIETEYCDWNFNRKKERMCSNRIYPTAVWTTKLSFQIYHCFRCTLNCRQNRLLNAS